MFTCRFYFVSAYCLYADYFNWKRARTKVHLVTGCHVVRSRAPQGSRPRGLRTEATLVFPVYFLLTTARILLATLSSAGALTSIQGPKSSPSCYLSLFTCNKLPYNCHWVYCECEQPAQLPVLTRGSSSEPPGTTSTIGSPPVPRWIQPVTREHTDTKTTFQVFLATVSADDIFYFF